MITSQQDRQRPPPIRYGCVCSGISAPTLAAKDLGWETQFFSEIDKFPRAVLSHHYPDIPLHADFTTIQKETYGTVDLLVGGTPCQSFSVAGKRLGLDDPRGNLALEYGALAARLHALWLAFENVPGLLSSAKGEDFAAFISAITGCEYRPPATGWKNAGIAAGRKDRWGIAWRILDAQYFGVAQRRRRLFVIGYRGDWRPAASVLLEPDSMRGDIAPSRKTQANVAALTATGVGTCGADDNQAQAGHLLAGTFKAAGSRSRGAGVDPGSIVGSVAFGGNSPHPIDVATARNAHGGPHGRLDFESETFIAYQCHGTNVGPMGTLRAGNGNETGGVPFMPVAFRTAGDGCVFEEGDLTAPLTTGTDMNANIIGFSCKDDGRDCADNLSPTLRSMNADASHANGGGQVAVCYPILEPGSRTGVSTTDVRAGIGIGDPQDPMFTLQAGKQHGIAVSLRGRDGGATAELSGDVMPALRASQGGGDKPHVLLPSAVRRLTPIECERLQGMPDNYTLVPHGKNRLKDFQEWFEYARLRVTGLSEANARLLAADGPRYKAIGNSMAVPCVKWIFERLDFVHRTLLHREDAA